VLDPEVKCLLSRQIVKFEFEYACVEKAVMLIAAGVISSVSVWLWSTYNVVLRAVCAIFVVCGTHGEN